MLHGPFADKPMVSLSDGSAVIHPGRMAEEFATAAAVGGILGAGQLAGTRLAAADPTVRARQGDYSGLIQELDGLIQAKKRNELLMEYEKHVEKSDENNLSKLIEKARNGDKIELTEELEDVVAEKPFKEIEALRGQLSDRAARKWYLTQDAVIAKEIGSEGTLEERARKAFEIRNRNRVHARDLMNNQEKRAILDRDEPNRTFEELITDKMNRKGLSREDAMKDILETAGKTRRSVNKTLGLE